MRPITRHLRRPATKAFSVGEAVEHTQPRTKTARDTWAVCFSEPLPYLETQAMQERILAACIAGDLPDTLLLLEHRPVVTLGRRGRDNYLLQDPEALQRAGVDVVTSTRGGDVTYHAPGQLVVYPIVSVSELTSCPGA